MLIFLNLEIEHPPLKGYFQPKKSGEIAERPAGQRRILQRQNIEPIEAVVDIAKKCGRTTKKLDKRKQTITSDREGEKEFFILNEESLSSLDKAQINQLIQSPKYHVKEIVRIPVCPIASVLKKYVDQPIDFAFPYKP